MFPIPLKNSRPHFCAFLLTLVCAGLMSMPALVPAAMAQGVPSSQSPLQESAPAPMNQVPPKPRGLQIYVNDYAHLLRPSDQSALQEQLQALDEAGIAQVSVVILPNTERDLSEFAPEIMNQWDIQHYKKKDGLLVLVNAYRLQQNLSGNRIFVGTGYLLEEKLPDALVGRVLDEQALPAFNEGEYSAGITRATLTLAKIVAGDAQLTERYSQPAEDGDSVWMAVLVIIFILLMFINRKGGGRFGGGGFYGGGFGGGYTGGGWSGGSDGGGFSGGFGGGGDSSGGGGAGR